MAFLPPKKQIAAIAVVAVLAVAVAAGLGLISPVSRLVSRAFGAVKGGILGAMGIERRNEV